MTKKNYKPYPQSQYDADAEYWQKIQGDSDAKLRFINKKLNSKRDFRWTPFVMSLCGLQVRKENDAKLDLETLLLTIQFYQQLKPLMQRFEWKLDELEKEHAEWRQQGVI